MKSTLIIILSVFCMLPLVNAQNLKYFKVKESNSKSRRVTVSPKEINDKKYKDLKNSPFFTKNDTEFSSLILSMQKLALNNANAKEKEIYNKIMPLPIMITFDKNGKLIMFKYFYMKQYMDDLYIVEPILYEIYKQIKTIDFSKFVEIENKNNFEMGGINFRLTKTE